MDQRVQDTAALVVLMEREVKADFLRFYGIRDPYELPGWEFIDLAEQLPAYGGAVTARIRMEANKDTRPDAPQAPQERREAPKPAERPWTPQSEFRPPPGAPANSQVRGKRATEYSKVQVDPDTKAALKQRLEEEARQ